MCTATPPQGKIALGSRDKITFRRFLSYKNLPLKIYFLLVELALAERDFKNAGLSFLSIFFSVVPKWYPILPGVPSRDRGKWGQES